MEEVIKTQDTSLLTGKVAIVGYGSQGHAHALNLADSGIEVEVGLRPGSSSAAAAEEAGLPVKTVAEAVQGAQVVSMLVPDGPQAALFRDEVAPSLSPGAALLFAHGFSVHYGRISPPAELDVIMVAPKGPGHIVRRMYEEGYGTPALIAVGPRVVDSHVKANMQAVLAAIQDGSFAREWIAEMDKGSPSLAEARAALAATEIERIGERLRALAARPGEAHGVG